MAVEFKPQIVNKLLQDIRDSAYKSAEEQVPIKPTVYEDLEVTIELLKQIAEAIGNIAVRTTVDSSLSSTSEFPVQNKVITAALEDKANKSHTHLKKDIVDFPTIPTKTSELTNDSGFISSTSGDIVTKDQLDAAVTDKITDAEVDAKLKAKVDDKLGSPNGIATLDNNGRIPANQIPGTLDEVVDIKEFVETKGNIPTSGLIVGEIYYSKDDKKLYKVLTDTTIDNGTTPSKSIIYYNDKTNIGYRWSGTELVSTNADLALGETSTTAYPGDKGKQNADEIAALKTDKANTKHTHKISDITDFPSIGNEIKPLTITFNSGNIEGTDKFTFDGKTEKGINFTPKAIKAANENHEHTKSQITDYIVKAVDWDNTFNDTDKGFYTGSTNSPNGEEVMGIVIPSITTINTGIQFVSSNGKAWFRTKLNNVVGEWYEFYHTGNKPSWGDIKNIPTEFVPAAHKHNYSDLQGSTTVANQVIVSNGTANGWTLKTLGNNAFTSTEIPTSLTNFGVTVDAEKINYLSSVTSNVQTQINNKVSTTDIINNLTSDEIAKPLSAAQGKVLNDTIGNINTLLDNINGEVI